MTKRILVTVIIFLSITLMANTQVFAANSTNIHVAASYPKGNGLYDVVVKDAPGTKLVMYINDKNPSQATVNNKDWATFHKVNFVDAGKVSFTKQLKGSNNNTYERVINYVRYYKVINGKVDFLASDPSKVAAPPAAPVTPAPVAPPTPVPATTPNPCTNGSYVNSAGNTVCSPESVPTTPPGATAQCVDGTYSFSQSRSGTCSHHGGVATWL